jgi:hypothetical protein
MLGLFQRPSDLPYPETDEPVDFGSSNALPAVFAFAVGAFDHAQRSSAKRAADYRAPRQPAAHGAKRS